MVKTTDGANVSDAASLPPWPVLSEAEREAIVARARIALFEYVRRAGVDLDTVDWSMFETGLQIRINAEPTMQRRFWWEPEQVIAEALTNLREWADQHGYGEQGNA
jgi:hypothetical protein